jgi:hypothetical protein
MSIANPLWGAPRIDGELLKLGIDVGQTCPYRNPNTAPSPYCCPSGLTDAG